MSDLPPESAKLLAVSPDEFVEERKRLVKQLTDEGKPDEAGAVAALRKPSAVVLAVNRAARDRPKAAEAAVKAAEKVEKAQAGGDLDAFRMAMGELDDALDMLGEVAVARVSPSGKQATDAMRRRVHDLLRRAVATKETRAALGRGTLLEEQEAAGFGALPAVSGKPRKRERTTSAKDARAEREAAKRAGARAHATGRARGGGGSPGGGREGRPAPPNGSGTKAERAVAAARTKLDRLR